MPSLEHHGIKGQKWGVRRYQNPDGTLTSAGKKRYLAANTYRYVDRTRDDIQNIVDTMSKKEKDFLGGDPNSVYLSDDEIQYVAKRFIKRVGKTPVAFLDIYYSDDHSGDIAIGTKTGEEYRGKGYASSLVKKAQKWLDSPEAKDILEIDTLHWDAKKGNTVSINLAKKYGFKERSEYKDDPEWWSAQYRRKKK